MEAGVALEMVTNLWSDYNGRLFIEYLVSDDDSSMMSHLRNVKNDGKLPNDIPVPKFLADLSHRIKTICSPIYWLLI